MATVQRLITMVRIVAICRQLLSSREPVSSISTPSSRHADMNHCSSESRTQAGERQGERQARECSRRREFEPDRYQLRAHHPRQDWLLHLAAPAHTRTRDSDERPACSEPGRRTGQCEAATRDVQQ